MRPHTRPFVEQIFTVDLHDYFHSHVYGSVLGREQWHSQVSRIEQNVDLLLELLASHHATATFFVLGWIARRHPEMVRRLADAGHEIASQGFWYQKLSWLTPEQFRVDVRTTKEILEDLTGAPVLGYRAPGLTLTPDREWAFDMLLLEGYRYDSSLCPVRWRSRGEPAVPTVPHLIHRPAGSLLQFPLPALHWAGVHVPGGSGGPFRHLPYHVTRRAFREATVSGVPAVFAISPWELDPELPRVRLPYARSLWHYRGLAGARAKLERLMAEFRFTSVSGVLHRTDRIRHMAETATMI